MMRQTPRTFIGSTLLSLDGGVCVHVADAVRSRLRGIPGISACELDVPAGTLLVTADAPVDRADVLDALRSTGCAAR
jgi:hypothetical protein